LSKVNARAETRGPWSRRLLAMTAILPLAMGTVVTVAPTPAQAAPFNCTSKVAKPVNGRDSVVLRCEAGVKHDYPFVDSYDYQVVGRCRKANGVTETFHGNWAWSGNIPGQSYGSGSKLSCPSSYPRLLTHWVGLGSGT
jgi:hypothetical protein